MFRVLPLLLAITLAACGSSSEYRRGVTAPARPPPTTHTPAGTGLPEPEHPGAQRRGVGRSTDRRVLPPEERPGVWASDGDAQRTLVLRIKRPVPGTVPAGTSKAMWTKCWDDVTEILLAAPGVMALDEKRMECLRHLLLAECGGWLLGRAGAARKGEGAPEDAALLRKYFPDGGFNENDWDDAMTQEGARRRGRRCPGSTYDDVQELRRQCRAVGRDEKGWQYGVP